MPSIARPGRLLRASALIAMLAFPHAGLATIPPTRDVTLGMYQNAPKIYRDAEGRPAGFFADIIHEIAMREGWRLHYVDCEWDDCLTMLEAGVLDLMPDVAISAERSQRFDFHEIGVAHSWSQIYAPPGSAIQALPDLIGRRVAVLRDSVQEAYLRRMMEGLGGQFELLPTDTLAQAFELAMNGRADAVIGNQFYGEREANRFGLRETPLIVMPSRLFFAAPKGRHADLLAQIDLHLAAWRQNPDSIYFSALRRAMLPPPDILLPDWARLTLIGGGGLLALFFVMTALLRWQVRLRTAELERTAQRLDHILGSSPVVLYSMRETPDGEIVPDWVSDNIRTLFGFTPEQALERGWWEARIHPEDLGSARAALGALREAGHLTHEYRLIDAQGHVRHIRDELIRRAKPGGGTISGSWSDLTERREQAERLSFLIHHDPLTTLPNRWLLHDRLEHAINRARREGCQVGVIYLDLDRFKNINDTLGHTVGDAMLKLAAQRMTAAIPPGETLARAGGDEFVLLLEQDITPDKLSHVAQRLLQSFGEPLEVGPHSLIVTASLGISLFPDDGEDADTLLKNGELALYEAKNQGRNTFRFFSAALSTGVRERLVMENALRGAIRRGELVLHYQPQIDLHSGEWIGAEALVRWQHPDIGLVPPAQFIPLAEESGLIGEIGDWVLAEACRQTRAWDEQGRMLPRISVNLSARQIEPEHLLPKVRQTLLDTGLDAHRLELEVTESTVMREPVKAADTLGRLKALGVKIAIDDFGTGHSSLSSLKRLPLDRLKIDQSFVRDIGKDSNDEAISRAIIVLARTLGLEIIAEGIEREEQADFLNREGCRMGQGYLFSRPMPAHAFIEAWKSAPVSAENRS